MMWQVSSSDSTNDGVGSGASGEITDGSTSYIIDGLESGTNYRITVRLTNSVGSTNSPLVNISTSGEGMIGRLTYSII